MKLDPRSVGASVRTCRRHRRAGGASGFGAVIVLASLAARCDLVPQQSPMPGDASAGTGGFAGVGGAPPADAGSGGGGATGGAGASAGTSGAGMSDASGTGGAMGGAGGANGRGGGSGSGGAGTIDARGGGGTTGGGSDASSEADTPPTAPPDFGPHVLIFDPSMPMATIQSRIDAVIAEQEPSHFGAARYAYFFKPGAYALDVRLGYYMHVLGLGASPDDVQITGAVRSKATHRMGNATLNFWRGAENLAVIPRQDGNIAVWAVSQGTFLRRVHVLGSMNLWDGGYSSGGFIANSKIDGQVNSGSQQQFLSRNTDWMNWIGGNWNMVFVGALRPPGGTWPAAPVTSIATTPVVREKPFLFVDGAGRYFVSVPSIKTNSVGTDWTAGAPPDGVLPIDRFYVATSDKDNAATINLALGQGKNLILSPGIYRLDDPLRVSRPGTIVLGLGMATLVANRGVPLMQIADVDGVQIGGILFDAGATDCPTLLEVGEAQSSQDHASSPTFLHDVFCRVGGAAVATASSCIIIHSDDVVGDNLWLWRADHGTGAAWTVNRSKNGLIVNGDDVTIYGLFVEHFQEFQTVWNGNGGRVFFYQSEMPYDPPTQADWQHDGVNGFASYKVADSVTSHEAWGLGVYSVFRNPVAAENGIETPAAPAISMHHMTTVWIPGVAGSSITHIINGTGSSVPQSGTQARTPY
jgi:hypothetical protein